MKFTIKLFTCALLAFVVVGQDAKIMILERSDTAALKSAYQDYKAAQAKWEKSKAEIAKKYTAVDGKTLEGWEHVEFSADFRAVVPKRSHFSHYSGTTFAIPLSGSNATTGTLDLSTTTSGLTVNTATLDGIRSDLSVKEPKGN